MTVKELAEFAYRTKSNPSTAAKSRGMKIIDFIETEVQIEVFESIDMEVFR